MLLHRRLGLPGLGQRESLIDLHLERTRLDQPVERVKSLPIRRAATRCVEDECDVENSDVLVRRQPSFRSRGMNKLRRSSSIELRRVATT